MRQDWQPLPLRMTRRASEIASGHRYGKRHDVHSLTFSSGAWWSFMYERSGDDPRVKTSVEGKQCFIRRKILRSSSDYMVGCPIGPIGVTARRGHPRSSQGPSCLCELTKPGTKPLRKQKWSISSWLRPKLFTYDLRKLRLCPSTTVL